MWYCFEYFSPTILYIHPNNTNNIVIPIDVTNDCFFLNDITILLLLL
jgi:hypothetical protein